ncbi:MAG: 6-hydroxymethylpterin diphosphokinase MptE-like protein [Cytophagaceae bacterium]
MKSAFKIAASVNRIEMFLKELYQFSVGVLKIVILSKWKISLPQAESTDCIVLGNGPSLNQTIEKFEHIVSKATLFCVNNFIVSPYFKKYKPKHYVILDPAYFKMKEKKDVALTLSLLKTDVTWKMNLYIPYFYRKDADVQLFLKHSNINVVFYNYTVIKSAGELPFILYKNKLASPQFYNVLGMAMLTAVNSGYKKVWLVGADHNWLDGIKVGEDNIPYRLDMHFYDTKDNVARKPIVEPVSGRVVDMFTLYWSMASVFKSYNVVKKYSEYRNMKIVNASEYSNLDQFERVSLENYGK